MIRNLEYQNQQLKKEVEELKSNFKHVDDECTRLEKQVECLLENDSKKGERINELLGEMDEIIDYYEKGY